MKKIERKRWERNQQGPTEKVGKKTGGKHQSERPMVKAPRGRGQEGKEKSQKIEETSGRKKGSVVEF